MPFTFSHPALILPLKSLTPRFFSLTGLVVGSTVPDFEYFIRMTSASYYSHTLPGLFWFDLPLGILLTFIYHDIVRNPLLENAPKFVRDRYIGQQNFNWNSEVKKHWLMISLSILIGAISHIFWDSFTHIGGYFVQHIPILQHPVSFFGHTVPLYNLLQHLSTIIGGIIIFLSIWKAPKHITPRIAKPYSYWALVTVITALISGIRLTTGLRIYDYADIIVSVISAFLIALILAPLILSVKKPAPTI